MIIWHYPGGRGVGGGGVADGRGDGLVVVAARDGSVTWHNKYINQSINQSKHKYINN